MGFLYYLALASALIPFIAGLILYKNLSTVMKFVLLLFGVGLLIDTLGYYLYFFTQSRSNIWLYHFYTLIECSLLIYVFSHWQKNIKLERIFHLSIPGFAVLWIGAKFFFEDFSQPDNYTASLECLLLVGVSFRTLYVVNKEQVKTIFQEPRLWISAAVLVYFSGNLLTFALSNIIGNWSFHHQLMNITANLLYTGGFLCLRPRLNYGGLLSSVQ